MHCNFLLQDRSLELDNCTKELQSVIKLHTDEDQVVVELNDQIKTLRHKMKQMTMDNSQSAIRLNTLEHENILFTQKLKESQERFGKLFVSRFILLIREWGLWSLFFHDWFSKCGTTGAGSGKGALVRPYFFHYPLS